MYKDYFKLKSHFNHLFAKLPNLGANCFNVYSLKEMCLRGECFKYKGIQVLLPNLIKLGYPAKGEYLNVAEVISLLLTF